MMNESSQVRIKNICEIVKERQLKQNNIASKYKALRFFTIFFTPSPNSLNIRMLSSLMNEQRLESSKLASCNTWSWK